MRGLHGEQQNTLKQELREELLQEFATPTSPGGTRLRPMAPPLVRSDATVGVVLGEGTGGGDSTGTGDAPGGGIDSSHINGNTTHSLWRREAISVRGGPYGKLAWYCLHQLHSATRSVHNSRKTQLYTYKVCKSMLSRFHVL